MKTKDIVEHDIIFDPHSNAPRADDHEVKMARSDLYRAGKSAMALHNMLKSVSEQQGLEGWVQAKITKAADYLESVYHYLDYEMKSHNEIEMEAAPIAPGAQLPGQAATPASPGTDALAKQKAAAAVALQRKQLQDQIKALQKQLQDAQKQMTTIGQVANAQQMQAGVQETTSAGAMASSIGSNGMGMKKKEIGSLFGGTYKQGAAEGALLDKHFGTVPGPDVEHDKQKIRSLLTQQMGKLPAKYERILRMRYFQDMTLNQIATKYEVGPERVRQIEAKALRMLKQSHLRPAQRTLGGALDAYSKVNEAATPAQQAAIAIAMKKAGKKPKKNETAQ